MSNIRVLVGLAADVATPHRERVRAFAEVVRVFQDMAVGYAYSVLTDIQLAEDAAQEAFVESWFCLHQLRDPKAFPGWFRQIVFTKSRRVARRTPPDSVALDSAAEVAAGEPLPDRHSENAELAARIAAAVRRLPEHERAATALYYMSGYTQTEVAEFLGAPLGTVKHRLHSARRRLRKELIDMVSDDLRERRPSNDESFLLEIKTKLLDRIFADDADAVEQTLRERPELLNEPLIRDEEAYAPLHWAAGIATAGNLDTVKRLLSLGADGLDGAFVRAVWNRDRDVAAYLLEEGADPKWANRLIALCEMLRPGPLRLLLELGADPDLAENDDGSGFRPLDMVLRTYMLQNRQACFDILVQAGATYAAGPERDLLCGRMDRLEAHVKADPTTVHRHFTVQGGREHLDGWVAGGMWGGASLRGVTLLHICAEFGFVEEAKMLLEHGADVNARATPINSIGDQTPIYHCVTSNDPAHARAFSEFLLDEGADPTTQARLRVPNKGETPPELLLLDVTPLAYARQFPHYRRNWEGQEWAKPWPEVIELLVARAAAE